MSFLENPHLLTNIAVAFALSAASATVAAEYPERPVSMIVPFAAGGPVDNVARFLAEAMQSSLGQTIVVENKAGAGGTIGTTYVANAKPDGYKVLFMHNGFATAPSLYKKLGYDPEKSFKPVGLIVEVPMTVIARSDFPADNMKELVKYLKANQDKVTLANAGVGLCGIMLLDTLGVKLLTVPYNSSAPALNDLLGKQVDLFCDQTTNTTQHIKAKTVKAYAITSDERSPQLPDLPTMKEQGFENFKVGIWHGLWVPAGTPEAIVKKLQASLKAGMDSPKFKERMNALGATVLTDEATPVALEAKVHAEIPAWAALFKKAGVQPQ